MANMMQNPEFLRSMSEMMSRPEVVEQVRDFAGVRSVADSIDHRCEPSTGPDGTPDQAVAAEPHDQANDVKPRDTPHGQIFLA